MLYSVGCGYFPVAYTSSKVFGLKNSYEIL